MSKKVSVREAVLRMDELVKGATDGKNNVGIASTAIGEVNTIIRLIETEVKTAKASGRAVSIPTLDILDFS